MQGTDRPTQTIRAFTVDHIAEPDAFRGTEHVLRQIKDGDGNPISPLDEEEMRRQAQAEAMQSQQPLTMVAPQSQSPAAEITPETPTSSPNIQRAPMVAGDTFTGRAAPVQTDPGVDWQSKARAEGWLPPDSVGASKQADAMTPAQVVPPPESQPSPPRDVTGTPSTFTPVPNAEPGMRAGETAPPPAPASGEPLRD